MDLYKVIRDLCAEKERLDRTIAALEELSNTGVAHPPRRRGRKSMSNEEKREISERMKKYWADRASAGTTRRARQRRV
jgi:hypothetical protein